MFQNLRSTLGLLVSFTLLTGVAYPFLVKGVGQTLFPHQANGSLVKSGGTVIGSELIGQAFASEKYFHPRPSAAGSGYDAGNSTGSNLAPSSKDLIETIKARVADLRQSGDARAIPVDLVTASGSGLDPDISVASAQFQAARVAEARGIPLPQIEKLITSNTTPRALGILGEARVNVLKINRELDVLSSVQETPAAAP
jgi:K+-transporting ATPase ATPase C chain